VAHFRKKPVVIEAYQFHNRVMEDDRPAWLTAAHERGDVTFHPRRDAPGYLTIKTLEGDHRADDGDWIIQGVKGELYPCKPDIFATTYEPA
jgi:hypothetical protein